MKYEALAPVYDRLMNHVEYDEWLALIKRVLSRYGTSRKPRILEIGGGTGVLGQMLTDEEYAYIGTDYSTAMSKVARKRGMPFAAADGRMLPLKGTFDLIIFLYDGINYLLTINDYEKLFCEVARCLSKGGLFLFDITTEANSLNHFTDLLDFEDYGDYSYIRHSYYDDETTTQINDFTIFKQSSKNKDLYEKYNEHHVQKVFPVHYIEEAIPRSHLTTLGIWDGYTFRRYSSRSERIHFLLKKK